MSLTTKEMETAAVSRPYGLRLSDQGITAYAAFFYPDTHASDVVARLVGTPSYSDGSPRPHLWFAHKKDAMNVRDILIARSGSIDAATVKHR